ncbi:Ca(2+)/H(+) antiporter [Coccomyxa sp. Obi]|nr:Ca(2+)/H(+) antiporter [Coccomyxa sp. Obi]
MATPYARARAAWRRAGQRINMETAALADEFAGNDPEMAQPIQRARQALRRADSNISARSYRSVGIVGGDEDSDVEAQTRERRDRSDRLESHGRSFEGHMGLLFSPGSLERDHDFAPRALNAQTPLLADGRAEPQNGATASSAERSRSRWRSAVRSIVAINSLRPPAKLGRPESVLSEEEEPEEPQHVPGILSPKTDAVALSRLVTGSWMSLFLIAVPLGLCAQFFNWGPIAIFVLNFIALVPLALVLGEVTEDLALRFGDIIGGLLNATFGNVVELILSVAALSKGLYTVVAMSLVGSILSNLLLVLGFCFLCGGSKYKQQSFNLMVNKACCSLLFIASVAIVIPTSALSFYGPERITNDTLRNLSHAIAILLILLYLCYLLFQLKTHSSFFSDSEGEGTPALSLVAALGALAGIAVIVAVCSEFLTGALEAVADKSGLGQAFLGLIVLPIAGNACEHITAVFVAVKDKMDLAIGVALGSSIQIAIFVLPVMVLVGWAIGRPFLLDIEPFAALVLTLSVIHTYFVSSDGNSNWLMGVQLISTYILIALLYLFMRDEEKPSASQLLASTSLL